MRFYSLLRKVALASAFVLFLVGCGGSGGSSSSSSTPTPTPTPVPTPTPTPTPTVIATANVGYLVDAPVSGATYSCGVLTGTTGTDGSFLFPSYDTNCTFSVGSAVIGSVKVPPTDNYVFVTDLAGVARSATSNPAVLNIAMFLQTMATNTDVVSKILLPLPSVNAAYFPTVVNIQTQTVAQLTALLKATNPGPGKTLVSSTIALANIQKNDCAIFGICQTPASGSGGITPPVNPASGVICSASTAPTVVLTSNSAMTANGVVLSAALNCASNGYYVILPSQITAPSAAQVIAGQNAASLPAEVIGNGLYIGSSNPQSVTITDYTNLKSGANFTAYFVATNETNASQISTVYSTSFTTTGTLSIPIMRTGQTTSYATYDDYWYASNYSTGAARSYTRSSNGIVTDNVTGLMWQDNVAATAVTWAIASGATTCPALTLGGYIDWRLPSQRELSYIVDYGVVASPTITSIALVTGTTGFFYTQSPSAPPTGSYWSSQANALNSLNAWYVSFYDGTANNIIQTNANYVRCVRGN